MTSLHSLANPEHISTQAKNSHQEIIHNANISEMYATHTHRLFPYPLPEYITPGPSQNTHLSLPQHPKGQPCPHYVTKRGFYMDNLIKEQKVKPGIGKYELGLSWGELEPPLNKQQTKEIRQAKKHTYIEMIESELAKRPKPALTRYTPKAPEWPKSPKVAPKLDKDGVLPRYHQDNQYLASLSPGSGNYCPHEPHSPTRKDNTSPQKWLVRHKKQQSVDFKRLGKIPSPGTYNPLYASFTTFDRVYAQRNTSKSPKAAADTQKGNDNASEGNNGMFPQAKLAKLLQATTPFVLPIKMPRPKNSFGTDARFSYVRPKKGSKEVRPSPAAYETGIRWRGKGKSETGWWDVIQPSSPRGVYH